MMDEPETLQAGKVRPRRAKRSIIPIWLRQRTFPVWLLYAAAGVLALAWSVAAYMIVAPKVEQFTHGMAWGILAAFVVGFAGAAAIVTAAYMGAQKIREA
jgi:hypothetical protein